MDGAQAVSTADVGAGPELVGEVLDVMRGLAESGMTMIVVTHEMASHGGRDTLVFMARRGLEAGAPSRAHRRQHERTLSFVSRTT